MPDANFIFISGFRPASRAELQRAGEYTGIGEATADEIHKTFRFFSVFRGQNWRLTQTPYNVSV